MRASAYLLYISPLLLSFVNAAPLSISLEQRDLSSPGAHAALMVPVNVPRRAMPAELVTRDIQRRGKSGKKLSPEEKERIKQEQLANRGKDKDEKKKTREEAAAAKKKEKDAAAAERARREQEAKEQEALMTEDQKRERDERLQAEREKSKQDAKEKEEEKKNPGPLVTTLKYPQDYDAFWKHFSKNPKGGDGVGWVDVDDIEAAFKKCMKADEFLFWSGPKPFQIALEGYEKLTSRLKIADAVKTPQCKAAGLGPMTRKSIHMQFRDWVIERAQDEERKNPKSTKKGKAKIAPQLSNEMKEKIEYNYYWRFMSTGFAKAAKGEVVYVRPDRTPAEGDADRPGSHWAEYERPALRARYPKEVTKLREVTFPVDVTDMETTKPTVDREIKP